MVAVEAVWHPLKESDSESEAGSITGSRLVVVVVVLLLSTSEVC